VWRHVIFMPLSLQLNTKAKFSRAARNPRKRLYSSGGYTPQKPHPSETDSEAGLIVDKIHLDGDIRER
jgi:hypothetical protein